MFFNYFVTVNDAAAPSIIGLLCFYIRDSKSRQIIFNIQILFTIYCNYYLFAF